MKRIALLLMLTCLICTAKAQDSNNSKEKHLVYCHLAIDWQDKHITPIIDLGSATSNPANKLKYVTKLYDEQGNQIEFRSPMSLVNFFVSKGWRINSWYSPNGTSVSTIFHYLLEKEVQNDSEITEGFQVKFDK